MSQGLGDETAAHTPAVDMEPSALHDPQFHTDSSLPVQEQVPGAKVSKAVTLQQGCSVVLGLSRALRPLHTFRKEQLPFFEHL